jgi:hypothetical protein
MIRQRYTRGTKRKSRCEMRPRSYKPESTPLTKSAAASGHLRKSLLVNEDHLRGGVRTPGR